MTNTEKLLELLAECLAPYGKIQAGYDSEEGHYHQIVLAVNDCFEEQEVTLKDDKLEELFKICNRNNFDMSYCEEHFCLKERK